MRGLEAMILFIICNHYHKKIRYTGNTVLMVKTEKKIWKLQQKLQNESQNKELNIKCKKAKCILVRNINRPTSEIRNGQRWK